jgi:hypothetical protein
VTSWGKYNHKGIFHRSVRGYDYSEPGSTALCGVELYDYKWFKKDYYMPYTVRVTCKNCKRVMRRKKR